MTGSPLYMALTVVAIVASAVVWDRFHRAQGVRDGRLVLVFLAAIGGAFAGAKLAFLLAEGWHRRDDWMALLSGRSVTGALIGGTVAVEWAKARLGVRASTGDAFAITVPLAVAIGRVGCVSAGCCPGVACESSWWTATDADGLARVPSAQIELGFNLLFLCWSLAAARFGWMRTQRFNLYLISYGAFRFAHEYWRDDHRWTDAFGGYHAAALGVLAVGVWMFARRSHLNRGQRIGGPELPAQPQGG